MKKKLKKKVLGTNPKDLLAYKKLSLSVLPDIAILHGNHAMLNGKAKYGAYNWRGNKVVATIYIDAIRRHALAWLDGEEVAEDSKVSHLGHIIASAAILLDAQATGNLIDDRPKTDGVAVAVLDDLSKRFNEWRADYEAHQLRRTLQKNKPRKGKS
jgi:hypothetical protein